MLKANQTFLNVFMIIRFKHSRESLNIALILALGCGFFSAKCMHFFLHLQSDLNERHFFTGNVLIQFLDIPYQELNIKIHLKIHSVLLCE